MKYKAPKAKKIYVAYDIEDKDNLLAFASPQKAIEETDPEVEQVYAVYQFVGLVKLETNVKVVPA